MSFLVYTEAMETTKERLGQILKKARRARGLRQEDIAQHLDVNIKQVGRWEKGENSPGGILLSRLVQLFRDRSDMPDLQELDAIVTREVVSAIVNGGELTSSEDTEQRLLNVIAQLRAHPRLFDRWITLGEGFVLSLDDKD